ncbi:cysteine/serine-rich nuclear protein 1 [Clonorchis sinensis]|uniref:Cysteine/serine-rich nuclear protein 1 n=1 Tax=Clonorchis sinensis TaxID=79923 RepID=G7YH55_CLOSI|nr:cysteine/serine-rich nuclear protein 1 [Clonorchis sinensis]
MLCYAPGAADTTVQIEDCVKAAAHLGFAARNSSIGLHGASRDSRRSAHDTDVPGQCDQKPKHGILRSAQIKKRNVSFSGVTVYSFAREQGFSSVPDTGWCSLGMARQHFCVSRYDIHHHQLLLRLRRKRLRMLAQRSRAMGGATSLSARLRKNNQSTCKVNRFEETRLNPGDSCRIPNFPSPPPLSPQYFHDRPTTCDVTPLSDSLRFSVAQATPPPPCLSPPSPRRVLANLDESFFNSASFVNSEGLDTDSETSLDQMPAVNRSKTVHSPRSRRKLLPVNANARIRLLRDSGVLRLDESEREVCLQMRATRSRVGCECGPRYPCTPGRCSCVEDGVQCQVDRASFPCSCVAEQCHNPNGRTEFPQEQVKAHIQRVLKQVNEETNGKATQSPVSELRPSGDGPSSSVLPKDGSPTALAARISVHSDHVRFVSPLRVCHKSGGRTPWRGKKNRSPVVDSAKATVIVPSSTLEYSTESTEYSIIDSPKFVMSSTPANLGSAPAGRVLFPDSGLAAPIACDEAYHSGLSPIATGLLSRHGVSQPLDSDIVIQPPTSTEDPNFRPTPMQHISRRRNYESIGSPQPGPNKEKLAAKSVTDPNSLLEEECIRLTTDTVALVPNIVMDTEVADQLSSEAGVLLMSEGGENITGRYRLEEPTECHSSPTSPVEPVECALSPDHSQCKLKTKRWGSPSLSELGFINRRPKAPFVSKSAPSSPTQLTPASLGRLSLRRRAIPRLPVTPYRRAPHSTRTPPNVYTAAKKQVFRSVTSSAFKQRLFDDSTHNVGSTPVPLSPLVRLGRPRSHVVTSSAPNQSPTRASAVLAAIKDAAGITQGTSRSTSS